MQGDATGGAGLVVFPVVLIYPVAVYWILRGKVRDQAVSGTGTNVRQGMRRCF